MKLKLKLKMKKKQKKIIRGGSDMSTSYDQHEMTVCEVGPSVSPGFLRATLVCVQGAIDYVARESAAEIGNFNLCRLASNVATRMEREHKIADHNWSCVLVKGTRNDLSAHLRTYIWFILELKIYGLMLLLFCD